MSGFEFTIPEAHPALPGHFPGRPIVPGVLLLDETLAGIERRLGRRVATLQQVKFVSALLPGETAWVSFEPKGERVSFVVQTRRNAGPAKLATGTVSLSP
jgi:3-hydroxyacyl-[acyl-carrier-protein] dehydratase